MRNTITSLILIIFSFNCFAQKVEDLKVLNHFSVNESELSIEGYLAPAGKHIATDNERTYTWFAGGRLHHTQGNFKDRLLDGLYTESFSNRQLAKKGTYKNGLKKADWYSWSENGVLKQYSHYKKGKLSGYQTHYDSLGRPAKRIHYRNGEKHGLEQHYQDGQWQLVAKYRNDTAIALKEPFIKRKINAIFKKRPKKD